MKTPGPGFLASTRALAALLLVVALAVGVGSCAGPSSGTTLAPTTSLNTMLTGGGGMLTVTTSGEPGRQTASGKILFRDDFQDGDGESWQINGAWAVQQDGDLYNFATSGAGYANVPKGVSWEGDYALKVSYLLQEGTLAFSFDATNDGRYYVSVGPDLISLVKEDAADNKTVLTQAEAPAMGVQHYLTVAKKNGTIQVWVDRSLWLLYWDSAPLSAGTIVVGSTDGTSAWVDDVLVNKIARELPQGMLVMEPMEAGQVIAPPADDADLEQLPVAGDDVADLPDENLPTEVPVPTVTFTGRVEGSDEPASQDLTVAPGAVVVVTWETTDASRVFVNGVPYPVDGDTSAQIERDYNFELEVLGWDDQSYSHYVHVAVADDDSGADGVQGPDLSVELASLTVDEDTSTE